MKKLLEKYRDEKKIVLDEMNDDLRNNLNW